MRLLLLALLHLAWAGDLAERGQARFTYWWVDVYDVTLHLPPDVPSDRVLDDIAKRIAFRYCRAFTAAKLAEATTSTMRERRGSMDAALLETGITAINACYRDVRPGTVLELAYVPGTGTTIIHDGQPQGTVPGADVARVLFSVWLGDHPIDRDLRQRLLALP